MRRWSTTWTDSAGRRRKCGSSARRTSSAAQRAVLEDLGVAQAISQQPHTFSAIDAWNYAVLGGAATNHLFSMDQDYFPIYHTQEDVVLPERFTNLGRDLRLLALALARAATAPRQTASLTALADHVGERFAADAARLAGVHSTN